MTLSRVFLVSGALSLAVGCSGNKDDDGDGLTNAEEKDLGLDWENPDTDGDGWLDGEELEFDSDPDDDDEVVEAKRGNPILNFEVTDHEGDTYMLRDLASQGKPILIDTSGAWCYWCHEMAKWLERRPYENHLEGMNNLRDAVDNGDVLWLTFISQDSNGGNAGLDVIQQWFDLYPHPEARVLVDRRQTFANWQDIQGWPATMWVNPDMTIQQYPPEQSTVAMERLSNNLERALADAEEWREEQAALAAEEE
jgi:hypothetical protein